MNDKKAGAVKFLMGLTFGLVIGTLAAPKSGKESRQYLVDSAKKAHLQTKNSLDQLNKELAKLTKKMKTKNKNVDSETLRAELIRAKINETIEELKSSKPQAEFADKDVVEQFNKEIAELKKSLK